MNPLLRYRFLRSMSTKPQLATQAPKPNESSPLLQVYMRPQLVFTHGKGSYLFDTANRKYLDFTSGIAVNALGHADPQLAKVMSAQANQMVHLSNLYNHPSQINLANRLLATTNNGCFRQVFLANSGAEANEAAIKFARKWGKSIDEEKYNIISFKHAFHGRTLGALSVTPNPKYQKPFEPLLPGCLTADLDDMNSLEQLIADGKTCAVLVEPIQGEGGVNVVSADKLRAIRNLCDRYNSLLIFDEIQCGLGRTGTHIWAHQHADVMPDMLTSAKPLANGIPIGAVMISEKITGKIKPGDHGTTFGGNPFACTVATAVLDRINRPEFLEEIAVKGDYLKQKLNKLARKYPRYIKQVRGKGLMLGMEMKSEKLSQSLVEWCRDQGQLLVCTAGQNTVRLLPPLNVEKDEIETACSILDDCLYHFFAA